MYSIIRVSDEAVVESNLTKEEAEKRIFFYDTEENPHRVQSMRDEE